MEKIMKIKKPTMSGMKDCGYLGHFAQDKYLEKGHNTNGTVILGSGVGYNPKEERINSAGEAFPGDAMLEAMTTEALKGWAGKKKKQYPKEKLSKEEQKMKAAQEAVFKKKGK